MCHRLAGSVRLAGLYDRERLHPPGCGLGRGLLAGEQVACRRRCGCVAAVDAGADAAADAADCWREKHVVVGGDLDIKPMVVRWSVVFIILACCSSATPVVTGSGLRDD